VKISFTVKQDPSLVRGCDEPVIAGDITKFQELQRMDHRNRSGRDFAGHARLVAGPTGLSASTVGQIALDSRRPE